MHDDHATGTALLGAPGRELQLREAGLPPAESAEPLVFNPNNPVTGIVERLRLADGRDVVRKVVCRDRPAVVGHWPAGRDPRHWNHWRREVHAFDEGFVSSFAAHGLTAPALVGRAAPIDGVEVLFTEHVDGRSGPELGVDDLRRVAASLGAAQGSSATACGTGRDPSPPGAVSSAHGGRGPLPEWWSRSWMWQYALSRPPGPAGYEDAGAWEHPVVVEGFGEARHRLRARFAELLGAAPYWREVTAALPATVAHLDCWANNVVVPPDGDPVLVDWAFCGVGTVGEDPGNLVPDGLLDHYLDPGDYGAVDAAVWNAYAAGLRAAGWPHPLELARLGMCLAVLKFVWLPALMVANAGFTGPTAYGGREGLGLVEVFRRRAPVLDAMLGRVDEARALLARPRGLPGWFRADLPRYPRGRSTYPKGT